MEARERFGPFVVRSSVRDAKSTATSLARGQKDAQHQVEIENWSTLPYDVEVRSELPGRKGIVTFAGGGGGGHAWTADIWSLAASETDSAACGLAVATTAGYERLHCTSVRWTDANGHRWKHATSNLPLKLKVTVA